MKHGKKMFVHGVIRNAIATGVLSAALLSLIVAAQAADDAGALGQWREAIAHTNAQAAGCFEASYPSMEWNQVECVEAPAIPFIPRGGRGGPTVGNGNDYAAEVSSGLISETVGSFPKVTGVKGEEGVGGANSYSLQLNSNFMSNNKACDGAKDPPKCLAWQQYVYSSDSKAAFMQYWLIHWDNTCPSGWNSSGGDCFMNSKAVPVPKEGITTLNTLEISGSAVVGGLDTLIMYVGTKAYKKTGEDSVVYLSTGWTKSEFNVFGDGGGSEAYFNSGSSITVEIAVTNGTTNAPICAPDAGTSGETNNLNLGSKCSKKGGATPYIEFTESNNTGLELTVNLSGPGTGTVVSSPPGIHCPTVCAARFESSAPVLLTETPGSGSGFLKWDGDLGRGCTGTLPNQFAYMNNSTQECQATFVEGRNGSAYGGQVSWVPDPVGCSWVQVTYPYTLQAGIYNPDFKITSDYGFTDTYYGWGGLVYAVTLTPNVSPPYKTSIGFFVGSTEVASIPINCQ